ncbi:MAG TPA: peptidylprolyl isomerase [Acidimicrobiia bacterium]|jgi:cyclophilin family peptidyl-prolyl cis-trans isomerase|nr:peptidylprolyl isomerase [Acidimicrobiia bacterium]
MPRTPRSRLFAAALGLTLAATACGGDDDASSDTSADTQATTSSQAATTVTEIPLETPPQPALDYAGYRALPTACGADAPPERTEAQFDAPDDMDIDPDSPPTATISTSCGDIVVILTPQQAPATVNSFAFLAESGYFDGTVSHRIVPGFVIQAGDPTATGRGGPGYVIADEFPQPGFLYERGVLAMANAGPGTTGSQFFIVLSDAPLPPQFSVFGTVIEGEEVLDAIAAIPLGVGPTGEQSAPLEALYINTVTIDG